MPNTIVMTAAHLEAFSQQQQRRFEDEMVDYFRREYVDESGRMGEARLRELIRAGVEKARGHAIFREVDVARFVQFMVAIAPDFDTSIETAWAGPVLDNHELPAAERLERIADLWAHGIGAG